VGELQIFWTDMAALTVILMVPALFFSAFMQRNLVNGLTAGALK
jgi:ABC-type glycerol-3-phosphate transport system permease component